MGLLLAVQDILTSMMPTRIKEEAVTHSSLENYASK
jgi:hypothetical protein